MMPEQPMPPLPSPLPLHAAPFLLVLLTYPVWSIIEDIVGIVAAIKLFFLLRA